jgi:hypothetical protein
MFTKGNDGSISIADQFKEALSEHAHLFKPASNDRIGGAEIVHKWLSIAPDGLPYLIIQNTCHELIRTLPELVHDDKKVEDVASDSDDHHYDSIRYLLKHVKWIDGRRGGIKDMKSNKSRYSNIPSGSLQLNTDAFAIESKLQKDWRR